MKALLIVEYDDEFDIDDLMVDYTLFHNEKKIYKMFNERLKPIPEEQHSNWNWGDDGFQKGWNECLDEILGENK